MKVKKQPPKLYDKVHILARIHELSKQLPTMDRVTDELNRIGLYAPSGIPWTYTNLRVFWWNHRDILKDALAIQRDRDEALFTLKKQRMKQMVLTADDVTDEVKLKVLAVLDRCSDQVVQN